MSIFGEQESKSKVCSTHFDLHELTLEVNRKKIEQLKIKVQQSWCQMQVKQEGGLIVIILTAAPVPIFSGTNHCLSWQPQRGKHFSSPQRQSLESCFIFPDGLSSSKLSWSHFLWPAQLPYPSKSNLVTTGRNCLRPGTKSQSFARDQFEFIWWKPFPLFVSFSSHILGKHPNWFMFRGGKIVLSVSLNL